MKKTTSSDIKLNKIEEKEREKLFELEEKERKLEFQLSKVQEEIKESESKLKRIEGIRVIQEIIDKGNPGQKYLIQPQPWMKDSTISLEEFAVEDEDNPLDSKELEKMSRLEKLLLKHFKVKLIEIKYKVSSKYPVTSYVNDYDGPWEISYERDSDNEDRKDVNEDYYTPLYSPGDEFDEYIDNIDHNGDHKEGYGVGGITVYAFVITLKT